MRGGLVGGLIVQYVQGQGEGVLSMGVLDAVPCAATSVALCCPQRSHPTKKHCEFLARYMPSDARQVDGYPLRYSVV